VSTASPSHRPVVARYGTRFASGATLLETHAGPVVAAHPVATARSAAIGLKWLCVTAFVLSAAPRVRVMVGPAPLYLLDVCAVVTLYYAWQARPAGFSHARKLRAAVLAFLCFIVAGQLSNAVSGTWILEPAYMLGRYGLAVSLFFSAQRLIASLADMMRVFKSLALGLAVTSLLLVFVSLPPTRGVVTAYVFNNPMLEPVAEDGPVSLGAQGEAARGRSLVGTSTLSGGFINTLWPFALLLASSASVSAGWKRTALFAAVVAPFGAAVTYARGAVLGLGLTLLVFSTLRRGVKGKASQYAVATVLVAVGVFHCVGWDSDLFFFERYEKRFKIALENPLGDENERARLLSYVGPVEHLTKNPLFFVLGEGNTAGRWSPIAGVSQKSQNASHSSFAFSYYGFGMIAALCNVFLIASATLIMYRVVRSAGNRHAPQAVAALCLLASLVGMIPWWLFGHATASDPRGMMLYMLVLGLVAAFPRTGQWVRASSNPSRHQGRLRAGSFASGIRPRSTTIAPLPTGIAE